MIMFRFLILILFFCVFSCSKVDREDRFREVILDQKETAEEGRSYFVSVPITKFSSTQCPCLDIHLDNGAYSVELDLGFRGHLTMYQDVADRVLSKQAIGHRTMYGIRGKQYVNTLYEIPKIQIGCMKFSNPILQGESRDFLLDAVFLKGDEKPLPRDPGRVGWCLFRDSNLLLDVQKEKIVFCDSIEKLQQHEYFLHGWTEVPMLLERGLVEFEAITPEGTLRCMLDTGATYNMLNVEGAQTIDQAIWDPKNVIIYPWFKIGDWDMGALEFHSVPLSLPLAVEAILGMDFFSEYVVFLDFINERIVFAKS